MMEFVEMCAPLASVVSLSTSHSLFFAVVWSTSAYEVKTIIEIRVVCVVLAIFFVLFRLFTENVSRLNCMSIIEMKMSRLTFALFAFFDMLNGSVHDFSYCSLYS